VVVERSGGTRLPGEEEDPELAFMPLAARRALDRAGRRLSLAGWRSLPRQARERVVVLGAEDRVDEAAVQQTVATATPAPQTVEGEGEPTYGEVEKHVDAGTWERLSPLARHGVRHHVRRERWGRLEALIRALA
jgi:hypothetical protein